MIKLLDCTLRDGGYVNNWDFGCCAIKDIKENLETSGAEIVELGFIKNEPENKDRTVFCDINQVKKLIGKKVPNREYAVMAEVINPLPLDMLAPYDEEGPEIVRVIVWKRMLKEGFEYCKGIVEKGYKLCVQPARVSQYSDEEFVDMIKMFNELNPMAIYVVDSWGTMYKDELLHYMRLADENLKQGISIGYHGHNNMMQAFEVACAFIDENLKSTTKRDLIIDSSVYGIGRGAGNLNTELIAKYMNEKLDKNYNLEAILKIYEKYISTIYKREKWGYSVPYFITAKYNANPNFASYYEKKGIPIDIIEKCISSMSPDERIIFKKELAEKLLNNNAVSLQKSCVEKNDYSVFCDKQYFSKKLALILVTANRALAVEGFLFGCARLFNKLGIDIIVYDSSKDNSTQKMVDKFSAIFDNVKYDFWDGKYDGVSIDNKVIDAYKKYASKYEYLWTSRDGLAITIDCMIDKINQSMSDDKDIIVVNSKDRNTNLPDYKEYTDCALFFKEQCAHMNTLGTFIVKSSFVLDVIENIPLDKKTYGMYFPMAFFHYCANRRLSADLQVGILWNHNYGASRSSFWTRKILWQWAKCWSEMINDLPEVYDKYKKDVLKIKTADFKPFSFFYLAHARFHGGLTIQEINKYKKYFPQVCETPLWQFYFLAILPKFLAKKLGKTYRKFENSRTQKRIKYFNKMRRKLRKKCLENK